MPYRSIHFVNQSFYHTFNRGVEKRQIFSSEKDFERFLQTIYYYQFSGPKPRFSTHKRFHAKDFYKNPKIVEIICYCLMPNHFHLLIRQLKTGGLQEFVRKSINSYTKYYNVKYKRIGPLCQGEFKATTVETDEQLLHLSRYIHLNPYVSDLVKDPKDYNYSSYPYFIGLKEDSISVKEPILNYFRKPGDYKAFVSDHQSYAKELERIKHLLIDLE